MIDPITYSELLSGDVLGNIYESFARLDAEGNVVPSLATSWVAHEDNRGFRFHLRADVSFHSGRTLTAADVKWSLEQLLIPGNRGGLNAKYAASIEGAGAVQSGDTEELSGITAVDELTLDVRFREAEVLFPIYPIYIMDRGVVDEHGEDWSRKVSAGTGPFSFVEWRRGQVVRLEAHDEYWGGRPAIDGVEFLIVPSFETAISMYEAGELDLAVVEQPFTRRVVKDARLEPDLLMTPAAQIQYLGMNQNLYEPFKDIRVREAICRAIDLEGLSRGLFHGTATPLAGQITEGVAGLQSREPSRQLRPGACPGASCRSGLSGWGGDAASRDLRAGAESDGACVLREPVEDRARHPGRSCRRRARHASRRDECGASPVLSLGVVGGLSGRPLFLERRLVRTEHV